MTGPKLIQRESPLPALRDEAAPAGFTYCAICRGYQHPRRHDAVWSNEQRGPDRGALLATYARPAAAGESNR